MPIWTNGLPKLLETPWASVFQVFLLISFDKGLCIS